MIDIDTCPFCGYAARVVRTRDIAQWWYCECSRCFTRQLASQTEEEAIGKWNTRVQRPEDLTRQV